VLFIILVAETHDCHRMWSGPGDFSSPTSSYSSELHNVLCPMPPYNLLVTMVIKSHDFTWPSYRYYYWPWSARACQLCKGKGRLPFRRNGR